MEACENYQKQSYRNRCRIYAAGGVESLNFPIVHRGGSINIPIREVLVDWSTPWLEKTMRCIDTAYRSSPFSITTGTAFMRFWTAGLRLSGSLTCR